MQAAAAAGIPGIYHIRRPPFERARRRAMVNLKERDARHSRRRRFFALISARLAQAGQALRIAGRKFAFDAT